MKIGILTIYGGSNYGNKLQNYALQKFLKQHDIDSETIRYTVKFPYHGSFSSKLKKNVSGGFYEILNNIKRIFIKKLYRERFKTLMQQRVLKFNDFEQKHITLSERIYINEEDLRECNYDYVIVGSDQVWNPFWQGKKNCFFLTFVQQNKRIAYAPSIGVSTIPEEQKSRYRQLLSGISNLSCREQVGANLITALCGKPCQVVVDPTLLVEPDSWRDIVKTYTGAKYIATYFLGDMSYEVQKEIKKFAKECNLKIRDIYTEDSLYSEYAGIEDFVSIIANAELFFTDSFHGCAFAVLMQTPFVICDRKGVTKKQNMDSRISNLMQRLEINNRSFKNFRTKTLINIDFNKVYRLLGDWRIASSQFLLGQFES